MAARACMGIEEITWEAAISSRRPSAWDSVTEVAMPARTWIVSTAVSIVHGAAALLDQLAAALPHHPRPELRVLELLDEAGDVLLVALGPQGVAATALPRSRFFTRWAAQSAGISLTGTPQTFSV